MAKDVLDVLDLRTGCNPEHVLAVETTVGEQDVAVGFELEQAPEGLHRDDRTGLGICSRQGLLKALLEGIPGSPASLICSSASK